MVHINLLPVRQIKQKNAARNQLVAFFLVFMLLLGGLGVIAFFQMNQANSLKSDIADLKKERQRHAATLRLIKQLEKDKALIETRIGIIKKLKKSSSLTVHALDETANLIPVNRLWLTLLVQSGNTMELSGMALDNRTIARFMEDLKSSPYITDVSLQNSSLKSYAGRNLKAFSLSCTIAVPNAEEDTSIDNTQLPE